MAIPVPRNVMVVGQELAIVWDDGREDYFRLDALRRACPCAMCKGEPDLFGKIYRGPDRPLTPVSVQVAGHRTADVGQSRVAARSAQGSNQGLQHRPRDCTVRPIRGP